MRIKGNEMAVPQLNITQTRTIHELMSHANSLSCKFFHINYDVAIFILWNELQFLLQLHCRQSLICNTCSCTKINTVLLHP